LGNYQVPTIGGQFFGQPSGFSGRFGPVSGTNAKIRNAKCLAAREIDGLAISMVN
jgi:hypothetical protein